MSASVPIRLGVNVDHVATLRNARGGHRPDPVHAAKIAIAAGADGITAHLREDRRHIRDDDIARLKAEIAKPLNFELGPTEGGLDALAQHNLLAPVVAKLVDAGIRVSLFIAPDPRQIEVAARIRAPA